MLVENCYRTEYVHIINTTKMEHMMQVKVQADKISELEEDLRRMEIMYENSVRDLDLEKIKKRELEVEYEKHRVDANKTHDSLLHRIEQEKFMTTLQSFRI